MEKPAVKEKRPTKMFKKKEQNHPKKWRPVNQTELKRKKETRIFGWTQEKNRPETTSLFPQPQTSPCQSSFLVFLSLEKKIDSSIKGMR